jgi:predicted metal-dependent peptidase
VIVVDTSGSIGTSELEQFAGEITAINEGAQPERIYVVYCDAAVQGVAEFGPGEPIKLSAKGGGGTDFMPPFRSTSTGSSRSASLSGRPLLQFVPGDVRLPGAVGE